MYAWDLSIWHDKKRLLDISLGDDHSLHIKTLHEQYPAIIII